MMVMEAVREIVKKCPYLDEYYKSLSVDRLGKDSTSYSIDSVPGQQVTKRDIAGNTTRQCLLIFPVGSCTQKKCVRILIISDSMNIFQTG